MEIEEIKTKIEKWIENDNNDEEWNEFLWSDIGVTLKIDELGTLTYEDAEGVHADGQSIGVIFSIDSIPDTLYRIPGYYSSWDISEFDLSNMCEVTKGTKVVTVYFPELD